MDTLAYVTAAAELAGLDVSEDELPGLAEAFALVMRLGGPALAFPVDAETEPAPIFQP